MIRILLTAAAFLPAIFLSASPEPWRSAPIPATGGAKTPLVLFTESPELRSDKALPVRLDRNTLSRIWEEEPMELYLKLPIGRGKTRVFRLERSQPLASGWKLETSDGRVLRGKEYEGLHYLLSENGLRGGFSFREDGVMGLAGLPEGNLSYGEMAAGRGEYVVSSDRDMKMPGWECGTSDMEIDQNPASLLRRGLPSVSNTCRILTLYMEADFDLYKRAGNSLTTASATVNGFFNLVAQLFQAEGIPIQMSRLFVWTSTDPYATMTSSSAVLFNFATNRVSSTTESLGHFVSTRSANLGGIAYMQSVCSPNIKFAFSNIYYTYYALPGYSWTVNCIAHEIGHNMGSNHTQWCGWVKPDGTTGRIDSCVAGEPASQCGSVTRSRQGTIMSYCHITSGGVNLALGFGPLPRAAMLSRYNQATCTSNGTCLGTASVSVDSLTNFNNSYRLTVSVPAASNATSWTLLEGSTVVQSGTLTGTAAFTRAVDISGKANGTYSYSVRLGNGTSTTTGTVISVTVAVPAPAGSGNCTATGLQAWYGTDGKLRFRFGLSPTCSTYNVQVCRYSLADKNIVPQAGAVPVACGIRNGMAAYSPTAAERSAGFIERIADPQPSFTGLWYSVDVVCSGAGCTTTNRTRTYIFVPVP